MAYRRTKVDISRFRRRIDGLKRATPDASAATIDEIVREGLKVLVQVSPRDTNRYVRAWIQAGNEARVWVHPLPPVRNASDRDRFVREILEDIERTRKQHDRFDRYVTLYRQRGRTGEPYYRTLTRLRRKYAKRLARAEEQLEKAGVEGAIFFSREGVTQRRESRSITTVRDTVYGGTGRRLLVAGRYFVELTNREPHARIVERHPRLGHPRATAVAFMRAAGVGNAHRKFMNNLRAIDPAAAA